MDSSYNSPTTKSIYKGIQITWYLTGLIEALLFFRFILKLFGANAFSGFVDFVYGITQFFVTPFSGIFNNTYIGKVIIEWTTLLAMLVYLFLTWAVVNFLLINKTVSTHEAAKKLNKQEDK